MNRVYKDGSALAVDSNRLKLKMPEVTSQSEKTQNFQSDYEKNAIISVSLNNDDALVSYC